MGGQRIPQAKGSGFTMITFLLIIGMYLACGYTTFRVWTKLVPPRSGEFGNDWFDDCGHNEREGWYIPAHIFDRNPVGPCAIPRGQSVKVVLWQSITMWPLVILLSFSSKTGRFIGATASRIVTSTCDSAVAKTLPPKQPAEDKILTESVREVEDFLKKEKVE